jgi:hypothetical protein
MGRVHRGGQRSVTATNRATGRFRRGVASGVDGLVRHHLSDTGHCVLRAHPLVLIMKRPPHQSGAPAWIEEFRNVEL